MPPLSAPSFPALAETTEVTETTAMIDKLDVDLGAWSLAGERASLLFFLQSIAGTEITEDGETIDLFQGRIARSASHRLKFTKGGGGRGSHFRRQPVLGGYLDVSGLTPLPDPNDQEIIDEHGEVHTGQAPVTETIRIRPVLSLNLTRFLQAQVARRVPRPGHLGFRQPFRMTIKEPKNWRGSERRLSRATNVLHGDHWHHLAVRSKSWNEHLRDYLQTVDAYLDDLVRRTADVAELAVERRSWFHLRHLEVYWEFRDDDPRGTVTQLEPSLKSLGSRVAGRSYKIPVAYREGDSLAQSVTANLEGGRKLTLYAKTTERMRLEQKAGRDALQKIVGTRGKPSLDDFMQMVQTCVADAARNATGYIRPANASLRPPFSLTPAYRIIEHIYAATENTGLARALVAALADDGFVAIDDNSHFREAVTALVQRQVLVRRKGYAQQYVLADRYRAPMRKLVDAGVFAN